MHFYAHLHEEEALAPGEWRFRTVVHRFTSEQVSELKASEGRQHPDTLFELVPMMSSPCDLYALAVLAVRVLLVNDQTSLPMALDEVLSLAHRVAHDHDPAVPLSDRVRRAFEDDDRWLESLGPQRLTSEQVDLRDVFDLVPRRLWWDTLAAVVPMFPGAGPDSLCRDLGDARPGGLHRVFDRPLEMFDTLLTRTRSLIVIDWRFNREIHAVIRSHLTGAGQGPETSD